MKKKYHVVYWAHNSILKLNYIGVKSFNKFSEFENYNTSSTNKKFKSIKLNKYIIKWFNKEEDAYNYESILIDKLNAVKSKLYANLGNWKINNFFIKRGKDHFLYGKKLSEKHKQKLKENHAKLSGKNHPLFGKKGKKCASYDHTKYNWLNIETGESEYCTSFELLKYYPEVTPSGLSLIKYGKYNIHKGWIIE